MAVKAIPEGYHSVQPYLMFADAGAAMEFYKKAFGATEVLRMKRPDGRVAHAEMRIGDSVVMMADEAPEMEAWSIAHYGGSAVSFLIYTEDCDAMHRRAVEAGGVSVREPVDEPYGDRMGGVRDPFGYRWWVATHVRDVQLEQLAH
jgi:PhnB protein